MLADAGKGIHDARTLKKTSRHDEDAPISCFRNAGIRLGNDGTDASRGVIEVAGDSIWVQFDRVGAPDVFSPLPQ